MNRDVHRPLVGLNEFHCFANRTANLVALKCSSAVKKTSQSRTLYIINRSQDTQDIYIFTHVSSSPHFQSERKRVNSELDEAKGSGNGKIERHTTHAQTSGTRASLARDAHFATRWCRVWCLRTLGENFNVSLDKNAEKLNYFTKEARILKRCPPAAQLLTTFLFLSISWQIFSASSPSL